MTPDPTPAPEWAGDPYLTTGQRFVRWNLVTLALGLLALGAGWAALQAGVGAARPGQPSNHPAADQPPADAPAQPGG